jgi:SAM-dependent methyltransferase
VKQPNPGPTGDYAKGIAAATSYWNDRAAHAQTDCERVEWSRRGQLMRFEAFLKFHDVRGKSILDVGCGTGDFLEHLQRCGIESEYFGFDLSPAMISRCRERFPQGKFESGDFLKWQPGRRFDYVISIGIHNIRVPQGDVLLRETTRRQFELCSQAAHVSILTDRYQGLAPHIQAWRAEEVLTLSLEITPYVALRHDYLPNDFSVTLYREPLIDTRKDLLLE